MKSQIMNSQTLRLSTMTFSVLLVVLASAVGISISVIMELLELGWLAPVAAVLVGVMLFLVISRTDLGGWALPLLESVFPPVKALRENEQIRAECNTLIDEMKYPLDYYQLTERIRKEYKKPFGEGGWDFSDKYRGALLKHILSKDQGSKVERCAQKIAADMASPLSWEALVLLYQDVYKSVDPLLFKNIRIDNGKRAELAVVLDRSQLLPGRTSRGRNKPDFPYTTSDITHLLHQMDTFSLTGIRESMKELQWVWEIVHGYPDFLMQNQVSKEGRTLSVNELMDMIENDTEQFSARDTLIDRLHQTNEATLAAMLKLGDDELAKSKLPGIKKIGESLNLISCAIYFTEEQTDCLPIRAKVCKLAAPQESAVLMTMAYLELRMRFDKYGGAAYVTVADIANQWESKIATKKRELKAGFDRELEVLKANLQEGEWWTRLPWFVEQVMKRIASTMGPEIQRAMELNQRRPDTGESLRRTFKKLSLETIERFLEARTMMAYLLTFDGLEGSVATLLDCFLDKEKWPALEKMGVHMEYNGHPKYVFKEYIKQCRLGIVPIGMPFDAFYRDFERDLDTVYENRNAKLHLGLGKVDRFEIIIHRFGLLGRDRYGFPEFKSKAQRKHALPEIRNLFAENLPIEDLMTVIGYQTKKNKKHKSTETILNLMLSDTVLGLIQQQIGDLSAKEKRVLRDGDQALKKALLKELGQTQIPALAYGILKDPGQKEKAVQSLVRSVASLPDTPRSFQESNRSTLIAKTYIDTLAEIAGINA
ncbi:MAG: hypothetical protein M1282_14810 [Chloroflexi bacterium]|nr:hypothetical protein [Chloroflexota bacterium]